MGFLLCGVRYREKYRGIVKIFGETYHLRAQVEEITGFSAHADRNGLLGWAGAIKKRPVRTFLVHGEDAGLNALADGLTVKWLSGGDLTEAAAKLDMVSHTSAVAR